MTTVIFSGQNYNLSYDGDYQDKSNLLSVLILNFPFQQVIWHALIFGWLKAAEVLRNPFGNPSLCKWNGKNNFGLNMYEELEVEIWKAAEFIEKQDLIPNNE